MLDSSSNPGANAEIARAAQTGWQRVGVLYLAIGLAPLRVNVLDESYKNMKWVLVVEKCGDDIKDIYAYKKNLYKSNKK